jgi:hypothetical protein
MNKLVRAFVQIATLKLGPEDLPASGFLLGMVTAAYLLTGVASVSFYTDSAGEAARQLAVDLALTFGFFTLLLVLYRKGHRLLQTLTALLGTGALLSLIALPLTAWLQTLDMSATETAAIPAVGIYLIVLWSIAVTGHILRRALDIPYVGGLLIGVAYFVLNLATFARLFPAES